MKRDIMQKMVLAYLKYNNNLSDKDIKEAHVQYVYMSSDIIYYNISIPNCDKGVDTLHIWDMITYLFLKQENTEKGALHDYDYL